MTVLDHLHKLSRKTLGHLTDWQTLSWHFTIYAALMASIQLLKEVLSHCNRNYNAAAPGHSVLTVQRQPMSTVLSGRFVLLGHPDWQ